MDSGWIALRGVVWFLEVGEWESGLSGVQEVCEAIWRVLWCGYGGEAGGVLVDGCVGVFR